MGQAQRNGVETALLQLQRQRRHTPSHLGLSPMKVSLLRSASKRDGRPQKELRQESPGVHASSLSRAVSELIRRAFLERRINPQDGRRHVLHATSLGVAALRQWDDVIAAAIHSNPTATDPDRCPGARPKTTSLRGRKRNSGVAGQLNLDWSLAKANGTPIATKR